MRSALEHNPVVTCEREYRSLNPQRRRSLQPPHDRQGSCSVLGVAGISGGAFGVDRDMYLSLGGFDETMRGAVDTDFALRLADAGYRPIHESRAVVSVRLPVTSRATFRCARALSRSLVEIARRHGRPVEGSLRSLIVSCVVLLRPSSFWHLEQRLVRAADAGAWVGRMDGLLHRGRGS